MMMMTTTMTLRDNPFFQMPQTEFTVNPLYFLVVKWILIHCHY